MTETITTQTEVSVPNYRKRLESYGSFEMYTKRGDNACKTGVKKIFKKIEGKQRLTELEIGQYFSNVIEDIAKKHKEVWDTEPYWHIRNFTNIALKEIGYNFTV